MVQYKSEYEGPWASSKPVLFAYRRLAGSKACF